LLEASLSNSPWALFKGTLKASFRAAKEGFKEVALAACPILKHRYIYQSFAAVNVPFVDLHFITRLPAWREKRTLVSRPRKVLNFSGVGVSRSLPMSLSKPSINEEAHALTRTMHA